MKSSERLLALALLAFTFCAAGQAAFPNKMSGAKAAKIAGQLRLGISEREMVGILKTNGLDWVYTHEVRPVKIYPKSVSLKDIEKDIASGKANAAPEAICSYALLDHCVLRLHVSLESSASTNRILRSASIESNGVPIASVPLKNRL